MPAVQSCQKRPDDVVGDPLDRDRPGLVAVGRPGDELEELLQVAPVVAQRMHGYALLDLEVRAVAVQQLAGVSRHERFDNFNPAS